MLFWFEYATTELEVCCIYRSLSFGDIPRIDFYYWTAFMFCMLRRYPWPGEGYYLRYCASMATLAAAIYPLSLLPFEEMALSLCGRSTLESFYAPVVVVLWPIWLLWKVWLYCPYVCCVNLRLRPPVAPLFSSVKYRWSYKFCDPILVIVPFLWSFLTLEAYC